MTKISDLTPSDTRQAFAVFDFDATVSPAIKPEDLIAIEVKRMGDLFADAVVDPKATENLGRQLETLCTQLEYMGLRRRDAGLASYTDITPQADLFHGLFKLFRIQEYIPEGANLELFLNRWVRVFPESRLYLYLLAELQFEKGASEAALKNVNAALTLNNVCIGSQRLLERIARKHPYFEDVPANLADAKEYLKDRFCAAPFDALSTGWQGDAFICTCPAWMPFKIGNITEAESADTLWNSAKAIELRTSILDGSFRYCSRTLCSLINTRSLPRRSEVTRPDLAKQIRENDPVMPDAPKVVELNHDNSCNLACPSCRTEIRMAKPAEIDRYQQATPRVLLPMLKKVTRYTYISGGGEAFASRHYRSILSQLNKEEFPDLKVFLITNAQLINRKMWGDFENLNGMFLRIAVSIDAATKETYERVRLPGKWENLLAGMEFLAQLRAEGHTPSLGINFVVQQENFRELRLFYELGNQWGVDSIWLQRLTNYGSYSAAEFHAKDVCRSGHPDHRELIEILQDPVFQDPRIHAQMLQSSVLSAPLPKSDDHFFYVTTES